MTAIVAVDFDWSIESCDKAPRDLDYERNTEKYGRAMKLTILHVQNNCVQTRKSMTDKISRIAYMCDRAKTQINLGIHPIIRIFSVFSVQWLAERLCVFLMQKAKSTS